MFAAVVERMLVVEQLLVVVDTVLPDTAVNSLTATAQQPVGLSSMTGRRIRSMRNTVTDIVQSDWMTGGCSVWVVG